MHEIEVKVTKHGNRKFLVMYYKDPITGKREQRSTKQSKRREADREAAKWEAELREGRYKRASCITWGEFRERYEDEVLPSLARNTFNAVSSVFNGLERICEPQKLSQLTAERLSYFQKMLREGGRSEATIRTYLAHLKASLKWAVEMEMLASVPKVKMPQRAKGQKMMKGRPINGEEFDRMHSSVSLGMVRLSAEDDAEIAARKRQRAANISQTIIASWQHLLTGLWLSGLRLGEALDLYWDDETKWTVDLSGRRPMFRVRAELEKGNQDRWLPMTPDFAEFLESTPEAARTGPVFRLLGLRGKDCRDFDWVSRIICRTHH